jgi:hypothetical protein
VTRRGATVTGIMVASAADAAGARGEFFLDRWVSVERIEADLWVVWHTAVGKRVGAGRCRSGLLDRKEFQKKFNYFPFNAE